MTEKGVVGRAKGGGGGRDGVGIFGPLFRRFQGAAGGGWSRPSAEASTADQGALILPPQRSSALAVCVPSFPQRTGARQKPARGGCTLPTPTPSRLYCRSQTGKGCIHRQPPHPPGPLTILWTLLQFFIFLFEYNSIKICLWLWN